MNSFHNVFEGKTVFITGDTGFKGAWLSIWLLSLGAKVIGYALPPDGTSSLFEDCCLDKHIIHIHGDVRHERELTQAITDSSPEFIFHLAAQPLVRRSYEDPLTTFSTNIFGTINALEAARKCEQTRVFINVTTDKVYQNNEWDYAYRECDPLGGGDPYSTSKACSDLITSVYQHEKFMKRRVGVASVRAGNVFGGGDWAIDRLVPDIVRACLADSPIKLRNADAVRPWQYVLEPLSGYLHLATRLYDDPVMYSGAWNFGPLPQSAMTVSQFVKRFTSYGWDTNVCVQQHDEQMPEANLLRLDCTKAASQLGWYPSLSLDEGLQKTSEWYKAALRHQANLQKAILYINEYTAVALQRGAAWITCNE